MKDYKITSNNCQKLPALTEQNIKDYILKQGDIYYLPTSFKKKSLHQRVLQSFKNNPIEILSKATTAFIIVVWFAVCVCVILATLNL